jgi:choline dehydrogenase-like flavoprotein
MIDRADIAIVGSGFGAAAPALRLAEAGLDVVMLEKGPRVVPQRDYVQTQDPIALQKIHKALHSDHLSLRFIEGFGGASPYYEMASFRAPSIAFDQEVSGRRLWPEGIDRAALDPYFALGEQMLRVRQIEVDRVPKSGLVFAAMMKRLGYTCDRARYAEQGCVGSGYCHSGCIYGAKQSLLMNYLPAAEKAGLRVFCDTAVEQLRPTAAGWDVRTSTGRITVKAVVLAAGTLGTARVMLASGLGGDHVGRHVQHNGCTKVAAEIGDDLPHGDMFRGRPHAGMVSYQFLDSHGITLSAEKPLPLQTIAAARLRPAGMDPDTSWWGSDHMELMKRMRERVVVLAALGLCQGTGRLRLRGKRLRVVWKPDDGVRTYLARTHAVLSDILTRTGCRELSVDWLDPKGQPWGGLHLSTAHQLGSCRMADSAADGVVDRCGEVFESPGLFLTDGSVIPSALGINPSLTILANAERIAEELVRRYA